MYYGNVDECFVKYLKSKGISCVEKFEKVDKDNISIPMVREQIRIISEFHIRTVGYTGYMNKRIDNEIGKTVEQYKVYIKKLDKQLKEVMEKGPCNEFEKLILKYGDLYLSRAKQCINTIYKSNYIDLIMRSMKRVEMCLGDTYFTNLRKTDNIEIIDFGSCCYNMCEMDVAYLLGKIKRRGIELDFYELILDFCQLEHLENISSKFILSIISYPYEFIRCCNRYREKSKSWTIDQYTAKLQKAIAADGESLI